MLEELVPLFSNYGFPIGITIYLLVTRDKVISENTRAISELTTIIKERKKI